MRISSQIRSHGSVHILSELKICSIVLINYQSKRTHYEKNIIGVAHHPIFCLSFYILQVDRRNDLIKVDF